MSAAPGHQVKRDRNAKYSSSLNAQDQIRPMCQESKQKADQPSLGKCDAEFLSAPDFVLHDELSNSLCTHLFTKEIPINPHLSSSAQQSGCQEHAFVKFSLETELRSNHFRMQTAHVRLRKTQHSPGSMESLSPELTEKEAITGNSPGDGKPAYKKEETLEWRSHICITPSVQL